MQGANAFSVSGINAVGLYAAADLTLTSSDPQ